MKKLWFLVALVMGVSAAYADDVQSSEDEEEELSIDRSTATWLNGFLRVTDGVDDRTYSSLFTDTKYDSGFGIATEMSYVNREEDAENFGVQITYDLDTTYSVIGGISKSTEGSILPEYSVNGAVQYRSDPEYGFIVTPKLKYSEFRNGVRETIITLEGIKYIPMDYPGYMALQANANAAFANPGAEVSVYGRFAILYGEWYNYSIAVSADFGEASYDSVVDRSNVGYRFFGAGITYSKYVTDDMEFIVGTEYNHNELFNIYGVNAGLRYHF